MKLHHIYVLLDGANVPFYVGKSVNVKLRMYQHRTKALNGKNTNIYKKMRRLIEEGQAIQVHILESDIPTELVNSREQHHIADLKSKGFRLCNMTKGGEGSGLPSEELKQLWSEQRKGRILTQSHKDKIQHRQKGRPLTPEHVARLKDGWKNRCRTLSEETIAKKREAMRGKNSKRFAFKSPAGDIYLAEYGLNQFCRENSLNAHRMQNLLYRGIRYEGWQVERLTQNETVDNLKFV